MGPNWPIVYYMLGAIFLASAPQKTRFNASDRENFRDVSFKDEKSSSMNNLPPILKPPKEILLD